jgi:TBC1 domain family member 14
MVQHAKNRRNDPPDELGRMKTVELIPTDLPRTFPALAFYQPGGPSHDTLKETLEAFAQYRPDIGYVQGMSYLAAILLLYLDPFPAFCGLCNLLNRPCQLAFYRLEARVISRYTHVFRTLLRENLPDVSDHLNGIGMSTEMFLLDWILTIYAKSLPLDISSRIWDVYILEGDAFLFRTAVAIFRVLRKQILDVDLGGIRKVFGSLCDNVRRCIISRCICGVSYRFSYFYDSSGAGKKRKSCSIKYTASS